MRNLRGVLAGGFLIAILAAAPAAAAPTPLEEYGIEFGDGPGELSGPSGGAVDAAGSLYVAEEGNSRVSVFARDGTFLRAFGRDVVPGGGSGPEVCTTSCKFGDDGGGTGSLNTPYGIALTPDGDLLVADYGLNRLTVWSPAGNLIRTFGTGGDDAGEFESPIGVAPVGDGSFFVAEYDNNRVSVVTPEGDFERAFGANVVPGGGSGPEVCTTSCQAGTPGAGPGELQEPTGAAADGAGNLFVGEQFNNRVSVFSAAGAFLRTIGTAGTDPGELDSPDSPAFAGDGRLHVGEQSNNRASVFTPGGTFVHAYGVDVIPGGASVFELCTTSCQAGDPTGPGAIDSPFVAGYDCRGAVYFGNGDVQRYGEPETKRPPCPLKLGKLKKNKSKGTAKLAVRVPEPGPLKLVLKGKGLKKSKKKSAKPGKTKLAVKAKGALRDELERAGEVKVKVKVKGKPRAGKAKKKSKKVKLVLND